MEPPAVRRRLGGEEDDLISRLPDELLHVILVRLPSAAAAARTSVLSRRWRGVWAHMPELVLPGSPPPATPPSALADSIDAALNSYAAPTISSLNIDVRGIDGCDLHANRIAPWLRFASQRHVGKIRLRLNLRSDTQWYESTEEELALPIFERATEIDLGLLTYNFLLRPPPTGSFSALTDLTIVCYKMDGSELGRVVSSAQCPRLRKLRLIVSRLEPICDVSVRSESLEHLDYRSTSNSKLEINAPMLRDIDVSRPDEACIVAPNLENVKWVERYDPGKHQFAVARRHLRSLSIMHSTYFGILKSSTRLMEKFDTVSELTVTLALHKEIWGYMAFIKEMDTLPICETLNIVLMQKTHAFAPMMLHLLRRCSSIRNFKLVLGELTSSKMTLCTTSGCPCLLPENYRLDDITFDSLEEIEICFFTGSAEQQRFVELLLSRCNPATLKRVEFTAPFVSVPSEIMEVVQRIRSMSHPNRKVQFTVLAKEPRKL